jgi:Rrf2 family nitric oxide-sensitive transcriptional repressor
VTIAELAEQHALSKNHLMKIVNDLARQGLIETTRGRGGGLRLLADPARLRIGDIVRRGETDFRLVECFDAASDRCTLTRDCRLKHLFGAALAAFFEALDRATLADIAQPPPGGEPVRRPTVGRVSLPVRQAPRATRGRDPQVPKPARG